MNNTLLNHSKNNVYTSDTKNSQHLRPGIRLEVTTMNASREKRGHEIRWKLEMKKEQEGTRKEEQPDSGQNTGKRQSYARKKH